VRVTHAPIVAVLGTRYPDFRIEESILGPHGASLVAGDGGTGDAIAEQASRAAVVLAGSGPRFDADTIGRLSCLGIVRYGVGVETVDVDAAARAGMWVANVPDYGTDAVAMHSVGLILAALRRLPQADDIVKSHRWGFAELRPLHAPETLTVGIVGFGRIGQRVAAMLQPFGFNLVAFDAYLEAEGIRPDVRSVTFDELISISDIVTLHAPGIPEGAALIGPPEIGRMKSGSILVNTARGSLIDPDALEAGLKRGAPGFAALDVYPEEPPGQSIERLGDKVLLTPHMAWYTEESERDLRAKAAHEAVRIIQGQPPLNVVARPVAQVSNR
jgi:D-3-phosphoglycerate dehydrogenase / 2-oxoglutarate reductase